MVRLIKNTDENYTNVSNQVVRDDRLSWKARGIFVYMWSQADNWNFYVSELAKHATDGEASLQSGLKELEQLGYLIRRHRQSKSGVFDGMEWVLTDHNPEKSINGKIEEIRQKT
ncbi:MAG: helix-turn-helix domain-containing protein [Limosilactobacillus pontis]